ncbi:MAG: acyclic terpene utilization AtuA family protein [Candidatus Nanopelagicales bacterium]
MKRPVRIANCSGFFGDRLAAAQEMVEGGPIDVLTGDWLAELTMLLLARQKMKHGSGYARTFQQQMEQVLPTCLDKGIKVVTNAGGLDPVAGAEAISDMAAEKGLDVSVASVSGDDLLPCFAEVGRGWVNLDTGEQFAGHPLSANAYLGARGIVAALQAGADVVVTGRVTDAALVIGPAAWWHGWDLDSAEDLDAVAGSLVAGHVIECGAQATGGNYAFFREVPGLEYVGFPIAEVAHDGTSVITKHPNTGGLVSPGTVTAQLLYEVGDEHYLNPDVTARFDTIEIDQVGKDRVRLSGTRGESAPETLKVAINYLGGFRNSMTLVLTGADTSEKADIAIRTICGVGLAEAKVLSPAELGARSRLGVRELSVAYTPPASDDPRDVGSAQGRLVLTAKDDDPKKVGKAFTRPAVESALASYPGMFPTAPPAEGTPYGVYWPSTVAVEDVPVTVTIDGQQVAEVAAGKVVAADPIAKAELPSPPQESIIAGPFSHRRLGTFVGARSGDKGGNANVGFWVRHPAEDAAVALAWMEADALTAPAVDARHGTDELWAADIDLDIDAEAVALADARYEWLCDFLTRERLAEMLPEVATLPVEIHYFPPLRAINVVIKGLLGRGVSETTRSDPQAKGLAEQLRAVWIDVPEQLL